MKGILLGSSRLRRESASIAQQNHCAFEWNEFTLENGLQLADMAAGAIPDKALDPSKGTRICLIMFHSTLLCEP